MTWRRGTDLQGKMCPPQGLSGPCTDPLMVLYYLRTKKFPGRKHWKSKSTGLCVGSRLQKVGIKHHHMGVLHADGWMRRQEPMGKFCTSPSSWLPQLTQSILNDSPRLGGWEATPTPQGPSSLQPQLPHHPCLHIFPPQSHRPSWRTSNCLCSLPPQGLCTCCSHHQEHTPLPAHLRQLVRFQSRGWSWKWGELQGPWVVNGEPRLSKGAGNSWSDFPWFN